MTGSAVAPAVTTFCAGSSPSSESETVKEPSLEAARERLPAFLAAARSASSRRMRSSSPVSAAIEGSILMPLMTQPRKMKPLWVRNSRATTGCSSSGMMKRGTGPCP